MKKVLLLLICTMLLTGCSVKSVKEQVSTLPTGNKYTFVREEDNKNFKIIHEFADGRKILSEFKEISYEDFDRDIENTKLEEALERRIITIDDMIEQMELFATANDGGSKLYKFSTSEDTWLVSCNTKAGNKNIIIGTSSNIVDKCVK